MKHILESHSEALCRDVLTMEMGYSSQAGWKVNLVTQMQLFLQVECKEAPKTRWVTLLVQEKIQSR